jgi:hypothetical protein
MSENIDYISGKSNRKQYPAVDATLVPKVGGPSGLSAPGVPVNYKQDLFGVQGIFDQVVRFSPGVVDRHSVVQVSVTELGSAGPGQAADLPFKGAAVCTMHNVVPNDNGSVEVTVDSGWSSPINLRLHFSVNPN